MTEQKSKNPNASLLGLMAVFGIALLGVVLVIAMVFLYARFRRDKKEDSAEEQGVATQEESETLGNDETKGTPA